MLEYNARELRHMVRNIKTRSEDTNLLQARHSRSRPFSPCEGSEIVDEDKVRPILMDADVEMIDRESPQVLPTLDPVRKGDRHARSVSRLFRISIWNWLLQVFLSLEESRLLSSKI